LQQLELNKEELIGKVSANHILEKKRMVWSCIERNGKRLLNGIRFNITENDILWVVGDKRE
jgi:hypothetical protein